MKSTIFAAALSVLVAAPASAVTLTNGTGDGKVTVGLSGGGAFGSSTSGTNATYDPIGDTAAGDTTFQSFVYFRLGDSGARTALIDGTVTDSSATSAMSGFSLGGLDFTLLQSLTDTFAMGMQSGSLLTQAYTITNNGPESISFELVRYYDGDLGFNGTDNNDGGGRVVANGREILFETDTALGTSEADSFIGIYNEGDGTRTGFEIAEYSGLRSRIGTGDALAGTIFRDGADADEFVDVDQGYDVTLGLGRRFTVGAGQSVNFTTGTIFGTGVPSQVVMPSVPEPATWATMLLGFGLVGGVARRRAAGMALA